MRFRDGFSLEELRGLLSLPGDAGPILSSFFFGLDDPEYASADSIVVVAAGTRSDTLARLQAALVLAEEGAAGWPDSLPTLRIADARAALSVLVRAFSDRIDRETPFAAGADNLVHPAATVEGVLEGGVTVGAGAYVGPGSFVGRGSRIEANAMIAAHCHIGRNAVVQPGAVIGCAGFGFRAGADGGNELMPHEAGVRVGSDCFIGANAVIAAGVLHPTEIGDGCKLDSHVQIAHNVRLGRNSLLASQSGVAGSTRIGENFRMGGAASVAGHLRIGNGVSVAAKSGVTKDLSDGAVVAGFPARPIGEWRRAQAVLRRLSGDRRGNS